MFRLFNFISEVCIVNVYLYIVLNATCVVIGRRPCFIRGWTYRYRYGKRVIFPYIFSKFNLLNTDTPLIGTLSMLPSVSVLTEFDCISHSNRGGTLKG